MLHTKSLLEFLSAKNSFIHDGSKLISLVQTELDPPKTANLAQVSYFETFAKLAPQPGYPEGIVTDGNRVYVSGPATFSVVNNASYILVYDETTGVKKTEIAISTGTATANHAASCSAVDGKGRLYVLSAQPDPSILRFRKHANTYIQQKYAGPFPILPAGPGSGPRIPLLNDIVFTDDGTAYVTDSFQATIWRIPAGGGNPEVWLRDEKLAGGQHEQLNLGVNGMRLDSAREYLYFSVTCTFENPLIGGIYRVPLADNPKASDIEPFHLYEPIAIPGGNFWPMIPDGFAFGASGNLYVALAGADAISVLGADGTEIRRITCDPSSAIPLDGPASIAFHDASKSLLITNHSPLHNIASNFAVLKVYVDDTAAPLSKPNLP